MTDNDIWDTDREKATRIIAENIAVMQRMYHDIIRLAQHHDIRVTESLEFPDEISVGHNYSMKAEVYWNPSSSRC